MKCYKLNFGLGILTVLLFLLSIFPPMTDLIQFLELELYNKNCLAVKDKKTPCASGEVKVWNTYFDYHFPTQEINQAKNSDCLKQCSEKDDCIAFSVHSLNQQNCAFSSVASSMAVQKDHNVFALSCCNLNIQLNKLDRVERDQSKLPKECRKLYDRSFPCDETMWLRVEEMSTELRSDFFDINNTSEDDCFKACANKRACVAFVFDTKTNQCSLRYRHIHRTADKNRLQIVYELHCCDPHLSIVPENQHCSFLKSVKCEFDEVWHVFRNRHIKSANLITEGTSALECRQKCLSSSNKCYAVSVSKDGKCHHVTKEVTKADFTPESDFDVFVLSCCKFVVTPEIVSKNTKLKDKTNKCTFLASRTGRICADPQWIIYENKIPKGNNLGPIKSITTKLSLADCTKMCNQVAGCLAFEFNPNVCRLRYFSAEENDLQDSNGNSYGNLECCEATIPVVNEVCYVDSYNKIQTDCSTGYSLTPILENNVECPNNEKTVAAVSSVDECKTLCFSQNCVSFEVHMSNAQGSGGQCVLRSSIAMCQVKKSTKTVRFYKACCKKMEVPDFKGKTFTSQCYDWKKNKIYSGGMNYSSTGKACLNWNLVKSNIPASEFPENKNNHKACVSMDSQIKEPFCIISGSFLFEKCNVEKCQPVYPTASEMSVCKLNRLKASACEAGYSRNWVLDQPVACAELETKHRMNFTDTKLCQSFCQDSSACVSFTIEYENGILLCLFKYELSACSIVAPPDPDPNADAASQHVIQRWWIGCCKVLTFKKPRKIPFRNCRNTRNSKPILNYDGTASTTLEDADCLSWSETNKVFSKSPIDVSDNFCRNFNHDPNGPWCITSGAHALAYCRIIECPELYPQINGKATCVEAENIKTEDCSQRGYVKSWIHDSNLLSCSGFAKYNVRDISTADISDCLEYCQMHPACVSFEYKQSKCRLKTKKDPCKNSRSGGFSRFWLGCCQKPKDTDTGKFTRPEQSDLAGINMKLWYHVIIPLLLIPIIGIIAFSIIYFLCVNYKPLPYFQPNQVSAKRHSNSSESLASNVAIMKILNENNFNESTKPCP